jgi:hypothetical protein
LARMSAAFLSAAVAGIAVIVGALMQRLTLRGAREDAHLALASAQRTARTSALSSATTIWEQGLREDLAEFATLTYEVETAFKLAMETSTPWPGEHMPQVIQVEVLFNRTVLRLDKDVPTQRALVESLKAMRDGKTGLWVDRRDAVVDAAVEAFRAKWVDVLEG